MFNKRGKQINAIVLIGMAGCGKTEIGKKLAVVFEKRHIDLDEYIVKKYRETIDEMFNVNEIYFRTREKVCCKEVMEFSNILLSTGGGTPIYFDNREQLKKDSIIIYIDRPIQMIEDSMDYTNRPLLENNPRRIKELYDSRHDKYMEIADFRILNDGSIDDAVNEIKKILNFKHINRNNN